MSYSFRVGVIITMVKTKIIELTKELESQLPQEIKVIRDFIKYEEVKAEKLAQSSVYW